MTKEERQKSAEYYDGLSKILSAETDRHIFIKQSISRMIQPGNHILDIGCGAGFSSRYCANLGGLVTAFDLSPKLIAVARERNGHENIQYCVADATSYRDGKEYDGIVIADVFEHIPRNFIIGLLATVKLHAKDKTWVFLNIPDGRFAKLLESMNHPARQMIDESYSVPDIICAFDAIGFTPTDIAIYGLDVICQYNTFVFRKRELLEEAHKLALKGE